MVNVGYKNINELKEDLDYFKSLKNLRSETLSSRRFFGGFMKVFDFWKERIHEKIQNTKENKLANFISENELKPNELICLVKLIELESNSFSKTEAKDVFSDNRVKFNRSNLKRKNLVFEIKNPYRPLEKEYLISYKAQLLFSNKKYSEEYQLLDEELIEKAKISSNEMLTSLFDVIKPNININELIIDNQIKKKINLALSKDKNKHKIKRKFSKILEYGTGTTLNFRGPPGTGKTMAANCIAKKLNKKLLSVRYDQLKNCYVGETEKNIARVFKMAKMKNAVLFFDEADAIALSRHSAERSWEMSQINTLLKELERFDGFCIFATNLASKFDPAFERRFLMHLDFNLPTKENALKIFQKLIPQDILRSGVNLNFNLENFSGGDIKKIILNLTTRYFHEGKKLTRKNIEEGINDLRKEKIGTVQGLQKQDLAYMG